MRRTSSVVPTVFLTVLLAAGLAVSGPGPASAKPHPTHARVHDRSGDAPAGIDLVSGTYGINRKQATFTAKVRKLTDTTFLAFEIWPLTDAWDRLAVFKENGKVVGRVYFVDNSLEDSDQPVPHLVRCRGLQVRWHQASGSVSVVWPQSCRQASRPSTLPFEFRVFSRVGGVRNPPHDSLPARTLGF
ncbi:MAG TPA: hypothetical protein VFV89_22980 [Nocardioides sp.]|uniref:hypothetical protein n=1 Tax=Nocardioides sp. TaxID=35761 RepID=UPI002E33790E|nr:hypothetical protein [Nocardioides sp.]HEX5090692.1 hypothetical protein [Nocardioides sp.]